jgi:hypothetical protein
VFPRMRPAPSFADRMMVTLGMPEGSVWARVFPAGPVQREPHVTLYVERAGFSPDVVHRCGVPYEEVEATRGFQFTVFGRVIETPSSLPTWTFNPTAGLENGLTIEVWWMEVPIGSSMRALMMYEATTGGIRRSVELLADDWERDADRIKSALRALNMKAIRPGPKPGTGAKYKTPDEWRAAIREKVLTRDTRFSVPEETIASWLRVSRSLMFQLMARWGPHTLEDMLNGKS